MAFLPNTGSGGICHVVMHDFEVNLGAAQGNGDNDQGNTVFMLCAGKCYIHFIEAYEWIP